MEGKTKGLTGEDEWFSVLTYHCMDGTPVGAEPILPQILLACWQTPLPSPCSCLDCTDKTKNCDTLTGTPAEVLVSVHKECQKKVSLPN